ncbi:mycothiol system anti-sigma-R factor [Quadrisphaera sp. INWT6]|uniref:mycothiol system anti-sigma-R factor n=1 Tax=Quadrisphaera sp. INWT6 TaxID=2596917 RepID=UPI00189228D4|nr:mycothiol system anti-sigma-R factor [Quadrisphaera sp. INWT6]MBF5081357.1 mycothiol system anti-sigma-R factor [Quadrisphaera sp. INWT6]
MSAECDGVLERIYAVLDGEVSADEIAEIHAHLEACPPCLDEYEVEAALKALVRRCCVEQAPVQLRERIRASLATVTTTTTTTAVTAATAAGVESAVVTRTTRVTRLEG